MMKLVVQINLLLLSITSVCLSASLTDDQLAQILGEKLQPDSMVDSREYTSIEDINEFDRRLAALEKLDEVTDQLLAENTGEEYGDGPQHSSHSGADSTSVKRDDNSKLSSIEATDVRGDDSNADAQGTHFAGDETSMYLDCLQRSETREDVIACFKVLQNQINTSDIDERKEKRNPFCGRYGCVKKRKPDPTEARADTNIDSSCIEQFKDLDSILKCMRNANLQNQENNSLRSVENKRNPFCGRYGCGRKRNANLKQDEGDMASPELDCIHASTTATEIIKCFGLNDIPISDKQAIPKIKRNPFCGRYGCGRKRYVRGLFCNRYGCGSLRKQRKVGGLSFLRNKIKNDRHTPERKDIRDYFIRQIKWIPLRNLDSRDNRSSDQNNKTKSLTQTSFQEKVNDIIRKHIGRVCMSNNDKCLVRKVKKKKKKEWKNL